MCTAMRGATPVNRCTCAASSVFSHGVRGTPGCPNTLNRVPVFPNAQEGSSISCCLSAALTAVRSRIPVPLHVHPAPRSCAYPLLGRGKPHDDDLVLEVEVVDV